MTTSNDSSVTPLENALTVQEQERAARAAKLRRFNRLYIYAPLLLATVLGVGLLGVLVWAALINGGEFEQTYSAGIADIFTMMVCLMPMAITGIIFPVGGVFLLYTRRKKGSFVRERVVKGLHKVDEGVEKVGVKSAEIQPKLAAPLIRLNAILAYIGTLIRHAHQAFLDVINNLKTRK